jgi:DHA1 family bicyclomycin/chloramphenicol resistance-like MFS transporter
VYIAAAAGCALAPSVPVLAAARFVQGLGGCAGIVVSRAVVRDRCAEGDAAGLYSSRMLVMGAAPILAPLAGGQLLSALGWRGIFAVLALAGSALLALVAVALPESLPPAARSARTARDALRASAASLRNRRFVRLSLAGGAIEGMLFAYLAAAPSVLMERVGLPAERLGLVLGANALGLVAASQANRWWVRKAGVRSALRGGALAAAVCSAALVFAIRAGAGPGAVLVALFGAVASVGVVVPNATASAMAAAGQQAGCASAALGVLQTACGVMASTAVSVLADGTARPMAAVMLACAVAASALDCLAEAACDRAVAQDRAAGLRPR